MTVTVTAVPEAPSEWKLRLPPHPAQVGAVEASANIVDTLRLVLAEGGQAALWRGALARALWLAPGCGITITVFEAVDRFVGGGK